MSKTGCVLHEKHYANLSYFGTFACHSSLNQHHSQSVLLYPPLAPQFLTSVQYPFLRLQPRGLCFVSLSCSLQRSGLKPLHAEDSPWQQDAGCVRLFHSAGLSLLKVYFFKSPPPFFFLWQKAVIWKHLISDSWRPPIRFPPTQMTKGLLKPWQEIKNNQLHFILQLFST